MDFFKALIPGAVLTFAVSMIFGAGRSKGGWLFIHHFYVQGHSFYWSWVLFVIATGLAWVLYAITPR